MTRRWEIASLTLPNARNKCLTSWRFQNAFAESRCPRSGVRSLVSFCRPLVRTETFGLGWAGWTAGLDGPCRDDANGFTATAALGEPAADLRRGAHPHVVFRRLLLVLCHSRFASAVLLMKCKPGTNGPKAKGEYTLGAKVQAGLCRCLRLGHYTRCSTRLLPRDPKVPPSSLLLSSSLYSTVGMCIRSSLPQPSVASLVVQMCPRFGMWPDITGASFIPISDAVLHFLGTPLQGSISG